MGERPMRQGYFSILRFRRDATRDEARNLGVILVDDEGEFGGIRAVSAGSLGPALQRQGILDSLVHGLQDRFQDPDAKPDLRMLMELSNRFGESIVITQPQRVAVSENPDEALQALYRTYVQPAGGGSGGLSKSQLARKMVAALEIRGWTTERRYRLNGFVFDIVATSESEKRLALEVLSFATRNKDPLPTEHDAAHFLFAAQQTSVSSLAIVAPPNEVTTIPMAESHDRVMKWIREAEVTAIRPEDLPSIDLVLSS